MAASGKDLLAVLMEALQEKSDTEEDKDTKTLFREIRDELRIMNGHTKESNAEREQREFTEEMAQKKYPALRSRLAGVNNSGTPQ